MRIPVVALIGLLALAGGSSAREHPAPSGFPRDTPVLGMDCGDCPRGARVGWFDPLTLRPLPGRRLRLGSTDGPPTVSPDGRRLLVMSDDGRHDSLRLVDAAHLRVEWLIPLGLPLAAGAWLDADRFVALVGGPRWGVLEVRVVDVARRRVSGGGRLAADAWVVDHAASPTHLVALLGRGESAPGIAPAVVAVVDREGGMRTVVLERIRTGFANDAAVPRGSIAGLAVDPRGGRAAVVAASAPVAEIDLASGAVEYRDLRAETGLRRRLHDWLEPPAHAKGPVEGSFRRAVWLSSGLIALTGDDRSVARRTHGLEERTVPIGVQLVDPARWSVRTIHERAASLAVAQGTLLAWTFPYVAVPRAHRRVGVTGYTLDGARRFELFAGKKVATLQTAGRYAYAEVVGLRGLQVIDLAAGQTVRRLELASSPILLR